MRVLDLGCGEGKEAKNYTREEYVGITGREREQKALQDRGYTAIKLWLPCKLPFKNEDFDLIIAYHILEHFTTPELRQVMAELHRVLNNKGTIIVKTPTPYYPFWNGCWTHEKVYDHHTLSSMLNQTGFKVIYWEYPALRWLPKFWQKVLRFPLYPFRVFLYREVFCKATKLV
jgi:cyclopropane fatty-acyl-phospholipid synthase-like methyltransferase